MSLREQGRGQREEGFDAFGGGAFNESAVRAAAQARANRQVEMEVARARMMHEMYNVLTPEQKSQLEADRQQRSQRRQEFRDNRRNNTEPRPDSISGPRPNFTCKMSGSLPRQGAAAIYFGF